jgi:hypothetical protein
VETKLTLRMDSRLIEEAKSWARAHGVSLSELVAGYFASLAAPPGRDLAPWTRRLAGVARGPEDVVPTDEQIRAEHAAHVDARHR